MDGIHKALKYYQIYLLSYYNVNTNVLSKVDFSKKGCLFVIIGLVNNFWGNPFLKYIGYLYQVHSAIHFLLCFHLLMVNVYPCLEL